MWFLVSGFWFFVLGSMRIITAAIILMEPRTKNQKPETRNHIGEDLMDVLKQMIRTVPDFPKPGIQFYDITTLLKNPYGLRTTIDRLVECIDDPNIDIVVGMEARGFIFAPALAYRLKAGFVPVRKPRKLPAATESISYALEYGTDTLEIHKDAIGNGHRVIIADDLLATGATARAVVDLVERLGGTVAGLAFVVELNFLNGRERLSGYKVSSLLQYDE